MDLILAFSLQDQVEKYGAYVGLAAFIGLAVLSLLYFAQARELKRLRDWAGRAPERAQELQARVVAQAEETLRAPEVEPAVERSGTVGPAQPVAKPAAAPSGGNGAIPMGPRPAVAMAAAAAAPATAVEEAAGEAEPGTAVVPAGDDQPVVDGDQTAAAPPAAGDDHEAAAPAPGDDHAAAAPPTGDDQAPAPPSGDEQAAAAPSGDDQAASAPAPGDGQAPAPGDDEAEDEDRAGDEDRAESGNGVPAQPPTTIPRATPRPQPQPVPRPEPAPAAAPLRASTTRSTTLPPRRTGQRSKRDGSSRAGLYTLIGILVLAVAIFVPIYFTVLSSDETEPPPNTTADPGATPTVDGGADDQAAAARPEKVVVVLNGTAVDGLASGERDKLIAAGYVDGNIRTDNSDDQSRQDSIVLYGPEERRQARDVARLLDISRREEIDEETQALANSSDETGTLPADIVVVLGSDKAP
jgi:hypothetical protein